MHSQSSFTLDPNLLPKHIAVIMDGNGRWAKARGKARFFGHKAGVEAVRKLVTAATELKIQTLTIFAFSSENWRRPSDEVSLLMELFASVLQREIKKLHKNNIRLKFIGDLSRFSALLQKKFNEAEALSAKNTGMILNVAVNYGGRWDILQAAQKLALSVQRNELQASDITEMDIEAHLMTAGQADVDLLIRTSGESRISNFVLWQAAYAEMYFTDECWPDFDEKSLHNAIAWFIERERRFGYTGEQIKAVLKNKE